MVRCMIRKARLLKLNININELNINYICEGSGEDVVLLHGWGSNITLFKI